MTKAKNNEAKVTSLAPVAAGEAPGLRPYVTLMEAIGDLLPLLAGQSASAYATPPQIEYQTWIRGSQTILTEHNAANCGEKMQEAA